MIKKLREIIEPEIQILSERKTKDGSLTILAPWIQADRPNKNGRLYPLSLLQREVAQTQKRIESGSAIGSADHPSGAFTTLSDASHIITKLEVDKNGKGWMTAKILPTSKGKNVIEIIKAGGQLGISARGAGTVGRDGKVESDYKLLGIDIVTNPSEPTATFDKNNVFESLDFSEENKDEELEKEIDKLEKESYLNALNAGFEGTQKEWLQNCGSLREAMGLPVSDEETVVEKLTKEQINARTRGYYREAVAGGYRGSFEEWKEKFPKIVETASKVKAIIEKKKKKAPVKLRINWNEVLASGFKGTIAEFKEKYSQIELIAPAPASQKSIVEEMLTEEALKQEAARIFTGLAKDCPNSQLTLEDVIRMLEKEEIAKSDKRLRKRAIYIVNKSLLGSGSAPNQAMLEKMVSEEIENLKRQREERRKRNWECYRKLLD